MVQMSQTSLGALEQPAETPRFTIIFSFAVPPMMSVPSHTSHLISTGCKMAGSE